MFLVNSRFSLVSAAVRARQQVPSPSGPPFSRSYGGILPSSLTTIHSIALVFSTYPPESVWGTGGSDLARKFSRQHRITLLPAFAVTIRSQDMCETDLPISRLPCLDRSFHSRLTLSFCVPTVLSICSTGISTCYPSTTTLVLALGPDLPRADQLYSGNLGYSA